MRKIIYLIVAIVLSVVFIGSVAYGASVLFPYQGGTGTSTAPTADQILIGGDNSRYDVKTLTAGSSNITITTSSGAVTIDLSEDLSASTTQTNVLDLVEVSGPANPVTDTIRMYSTEDADFTVVETVDSLGTVWRNNQDIFRVARNNSGSEIAKGKAVYYYGSTGNKPDFRLAQANSSTTMAVVAITTAAVADGAFGQIMIIGRLTGVDTSAFAEGDELWVDSAVAGGLTNVKPTHPNLAQWIGTVEVSGVSGVILVNIQDLNGIEDGTIMNSFTIGDTLAGTKTLSFDGTTDGSLAWDSDNDYFTIDNDLNVTGSATTTGSFVAGSTLYVDQSDGRVGIGTASPNESLEVVGNERITEELILRAASGTDFRGITLTDDSYNSIGSFQSFLSGATTYLFYSANRYYNGSAWANYNANAGSTLYLYNNEIRFYRFSAGSNSPQFNGSFDGDGNFGIGVDATAKLHVAGNVLFQNGTDSTTGFQVLDANGGIPVLNVDTANERVGIGTSTPGGTYGEKLTISGDGYIEGNATTSGAHSIGELSVNNAYWFPTTAGTNGQVLKTDASGILTWQDDTSGGGGAALGWTYDQGDSEILYRSTTTDPTVIGGSATTSAAALFEVIGATELDNVTSTWLYVGNDITLGGEIYAGSNMNASTNGATIASPRVFGFRDLSANEAARFQFGDEHNALQNAYANDVNLYSYWGLVLTGGRQNFSSGFVPMGFSKTLDYGVLVKSDTAGSGNDGGSSGNPITTLGIQATSSQWANLTEWVDSADTTLSIVDYLGHFVIGGTATTSYSLSVVGDTDLDNVTSTWLYVTNDLTVAGDTSLQGATSTAFYSSGDITAAVNLSAATYGSDGSVSDAEFLYINTLSGNVQTQISNILDGTTAFTDFNGTVIDSDNYVADSIDDTHINWGTGASQVSTDDVTEGSTNLYQDSELTDWIDNVTLNTNGSLDTEGYVSSTTGIWGQGALHIGGNTTLDGTLSVATALFSIDASGNIITNGYASTTGGLFTQGNMNVGGNATTGPLFVEGYRIYPLPPVGASYVSSTLSTFTGATTTVPLGAAVAAETWSTCYVYTDSGTTTIQFTDGAGNGMGYFDAARYQDDVKPSITLSSNNSFVVGEGRLWQIGGVLGSPTYVSFSCQRTYSAD